MLTPPRVAVWTANVTRSRSAFASTGTFASGAATGIPIPPTSWHVEHHYGLIGFMRACDSWEQFYNMVQRAFPKKGETLFLPLATEPRV